MRAITKFAAAAAALSLTAFAGSASAAVVLGLSSDGGTTIVPGTDLNPLADVLNAFDIFGGFQISTNADIGIAPTLLNSTTIDTKFVGTAPSTIDIYVTRTDVLGPMPAGGYKSSFTNNILPDGWSVRERTYVSGANLLFTGTALGDKTFLTPGTDTQFNAALGGGSPYSVTTRYTISAPGGGSALSTITLSSAAVPEPGTWALMIVGFGGAGALLRRRRQAAVAA
jgi:hypothetical protein